jgi:RNA polymerase sigma-70 factor (ECF subfamily)
MRQEDPGGFDLVYREYGSLVRAVCLRILRNRTEAEDAAQDAFLNIFRKIHTFRGDSALSTWLYRVTTNTVLMRVRKNRRDSVAPNEPRERENSYRAHNSGHDPSLTNFLREIDLQTALDSLPEGYKTVFVLHDVQGYGHKEISRILGRSVGDSKSQLHRARKRLREFLGDAKRLSGLESGPKMEHLEDSVSDIEVSHEFGELSQKTNAIQPSS